MTNDAKAAARALGGFIDASPSPYHACAAVAARLEGAGFRRLEEGAAWRLSAGRWYVRRGGSIVAWAQAEGLAAHTPFRVAGAHTDSPNLRLKPRPDTGAAGFRQLGVEVYGSALLNSWLNRDLGLSGRAWVRGESGREERTFHIDRALLCIPQLAIHLNREIRTDGLKLDPQRHLVPVWRHEDGTERGFVQLLAEELSVEPDAIYSWNAMCHDVTRSSLLGDRQEFLSAPRLDNLCSCFCDVTALLERLEQGTPRSAIPVVALFDHEEVGSGSASGAKSPLLAGVLERVVQSLGGGRQDFLRAVAESFCVSTDMAHATHPNYVAQHDPEHHLRLDAGPVIKVNACQSYATESETEALFQEACERADVPFQKWVNRADLACGSTIGPLTAANLGMRTIDVGNAQLSMHAARELCGSLDPGFLIRALVAFWE